jgi:hypothetical protein
MSARSRRNSEAPTANWAQNREMATVERHDRACVVPISQHHIGRVRYADALVTVLFDDADGLFKLRLAKIGQFPRAA